MGALMGRFPTPATPVRAACPLFFSSVPPLTRLAAPGKAGLPPPAFLSPRPPATSPAIVWRRSSPAKEPRWQRCRQSRKAWNLAVCARSMRVCFCAQARACECVFVCAYACAGGRARAIALALAPPPSPSLPPSLLRVSPSHTPWLARSFSLTRARARARARSLSL